jgi:DNA processing protein
MQKRGEILLALNATGKIGPRTFEYLRKMFNDDFEKFFTAPESKLKKLLPDKILGLFLEAKRIDPGGEIKKLKSVGVDYTTIYDNDYPPLLKEIFDAPYILYYRGDPKVLSSSAIAIVGSRKFTQYGKTVGYKLSYELAETGLTIVSGLALGLDSIVQRAAVDAKGITVGVLACGIDQVYPLTNRSLADRIIDNGGAIVTEKAPGTPPLKQHFPARNRIISGLSLATLVVEAAESSGSLITAAAALEQNREVFAVPGNINSPSSKGTNNLIKLGAKPVTETNDILINLNIEPLKVPKKIYTFSENETLVVDILKAGAIHIDKVAQTSKLDIVQISETLTMLEIKGAVRNMGGGVWSLNII